MWNELKQRLPVYRRIRRQRDEALAARTQAEQQLHAADAARLRAELQCEAAEAARWEAVRQCEQAEQARWEAERQRAQAEQARWEAERQREQAEQARWRAVRQREEINGPGRHALHSRLDIIQRSINLVAARTPVVARPIRVLFVAHFAQAWMTLENVYRAMADDPDFEPVVATIDHRFNGNEPFSGEAALSAMLEARDIPHLRWGALPGHEGAMLVTSLAPDVVFLQTHWPDSFPEPLQPRNIGFARTCYVHYGQELTSAGHDDAVFNSEYVLGAWRVFCGSEIVRAMYEARSRKGAGHVVVTGNPKLEYLQGLRRSAGDWPVRGHPGRLRVLWAVHHSIEPGGSGVFPAIYRDMLAWAQNEPGMEFAVTFHHLFRSKVETSDRIDLQELDAFVAAWEALPNTGIYRNPDIGPAFAASDVLITDTTSFPVEYQVMDKPLIAFEASDYALTELGRHVFEGIYRVRAVDDAADMIRRFRAERYDPLALQRSDIAKSMLPHPEGATRRIVNEIRNAIFTEPHAVRPVARVSRIKSV